MTKSEIRNDIKRQLTSLEHDVYKSYSEEIKQIFLSELTSNDISVIGLTISKFPEVDTKELIHQLWRMGKKVALPKCHAKERSMTFYIVENFQQLENVYMDLLEPIPEKTTSVLMEDIDLLVVPGIVYSKSGYRIGYGGGYYDRFLVSYKGETISLAFDFQVLDEIPTDLHDLPVNRIITNREVINCMVRRKAGK